MKAHLMFRDRDFDPAAVLAPSRAVLAQDLELGPLLAAMAAGDAFLLAACRVAVLTGHAAIPTRSPTARTCLATACRTRTWSGRCTR